MNKTQQVQSVLTIVMAILFGSFKSGFLGFAMLTCMVMLILSVSRSDQ